jgi:hypothetical protein
MSLTDAELYDEGVTRLKEIARREGVTGYSKYRSNNKRELVEIIIKNRKRLPPQSAGFKPLKRTCSSYTIADLKQMVIDNNLQIAGKVTKKSICDAYDKKKAEQAPIIKGRTLGKKCMSYSKQELKDMAIRLHLLSSGTKTDLCKRILTVYDDPPKKCMDNTVAALKEQALQMGIGVRKMKKQQICDELEKAGWKPPAVVKPAVVKPAVVKPAVVKPAVVKPATVKPAVVKPAVVKPAPVKPATGKPATGKPVVGKSSVKLSKEIIKNSDYRALLKLVSREDVIRFAIRNGFADQINLPTDEILQNMWMVFNDDSSDEEVTIQPDEDVTTMIRAGDDEDVTTMIRAGDEEDATTTIRAGDEEDATTTIRAGDDEDVTTMIRAGDEEDATTMIRADDDEDATTMIRAGDDATIRQIQKIIDDLRRKLDSSAMSPALMDEIENEIQGYKRMLHDIQLKGPRQRTPPVQPTSPPSRRTPPVQPTSPPRQRTPPVRRRTPLVQPPSPSSRRTPSVQPTSPPVQPPSPSRQRTPPVQPPSPSSRQTDEDVEREAVEKERERQRERLRKQRLIPPRERVLEVTAISDIENQLSEITAPVVVPPTSMGEIRRSIFKELGLIF